MTDDTDRQAIRSAEMEVDVDDDIETTAHRGWDRDDYDVDEIGEFTAIEPGDGVDWEGVLDRIRQRLVDLPEEKIEAHLEGGSE